MICSYLLHGVTSFEFSNCEKENEAKLSSSVQFENENDVITM